MKASSAKPRVALTGGIASGKSFVASLFEELGAIIVDSDVLAREVVAPGTPGLAEVVTRFGSKVLLPDGQLNRAKLAEIVFGDDAARGDLNAIIHPRVRARAEALEATAPAGSIVIQVVPLLVETGLDEGFEVVIVVDVPLHAQLERLRIRNGLNVEDSLARIEAQASRAERLAKATHVIDNSGNRETARGQVVDIWREIADRSATA